MQHKTIFTLRSLLNELNFTWKIELMMVRKKDSNV